ncbi:MAG: RnfABCDGE type electron transport complex subunit D, partial [Clostridia bacterium]|nr:RnfABCDGE type electron transport complex subunit D [Clostridia bacterium]
MYNILRGQAIGGIGTTCILMLLICLAALIYTGTVDYKITLFSVLSYFIVGLLFNGVEKNVMNMLSGSFIFVSIFIVTDPNTSPNTII